MVLWKNEYWLPILWLKLTSLIYPIQAHQNAGLFALEFGTEVPI